MMLGCFIVTKEEGLTKPNALNNYFCAICLIFLINQSTKHQQQNLRVEVVSEEAGDVICSL